MSDAPLKQFPRAPFYVGGRPALVALTYWLRDIPDFSAFEAAVDVRGRDIIKLGRRREASKARPARWYGQDLIVCDTRALCEQAVAIVRDALAESPRRARAA